GVRGGGVPGGGGRAGREGRPPPPARLVPPDGRRGGQRVPDRLPVPPPVGAGRRAGPPAAAVLFSGDVSGDAGGAGRGEPQRLRGGPVLVLVRGRLRRLRPRRRLELLPPPPQRPRLRAHPKGGRPGRGGPRAHCPAGGTGRAGPGPVVVLVVPLRPGPGRPGDGLGLLPRLPLAERGGPAGEGESGPGLAPRRPAAGGPVHDLVVGGPLTRRP